MLGADDEDRSVSNMIAMSLVFALLDQLIGTVGRKIQRISGNQSIRSSKLVSFIFFFVIRVVEYKMNIGS